VFKIPGGVLAEMCRLADEGMTMIVVTPEMGFAREVGSSIVFLCDGQSWRRALAKRS